MRSSPAATTPTIRLRSPGEIVSAVPYLLGFSPESSLVLLGLRAKQIALTCRVDLSDASDEQCVRSIIGALTRSGASRALLVGYGSARDVTAPVLATTTDQLETAGIAVPERISVVGGRWFHEACADARCCPDEGVPVADHDEAPSTMSIHAHSGGYRQDRAALVAECYPDRPVLLAAIRSELRLLVTEDRELTDEDVTAALATVLGWGSGEPPTAAQLALAATATADPLVRDVCYALVAPGMLGEHEPDLDSIHGALRCAGVDAGDLDRVGILLDGEARDRVLDRVLAWVRNLPDDVPGATMPALLVAAVAHWCAGDGARALTLVERAHGLDAEPLPMLETLTTCIANGVRLAELGHLGHLADDRPGRGPSGRSVA